MCERFRDEPFPLMLEFLKPFGGSARAEHNCGAYFYFISYTAYTEATKPGAKVCIASGRVVH